MSAPRAPHPVEGHWVGALFVRAFIARGRRATVWWADSDLGPVALRVPHPGVPRAPFDAEQRRAYAASGRRGDLRPEGAVEPLVRGDDLAAIIEGAESNGPIDELGLGGLAQGVLSALAEHPAGHGDLVPGHVLIGEAGTVRLIDAAPDRFVERQSLPGRAPWLHPSASASASDLSALVALLTRAWGSARLPEERPPAWLAGLAAAPTPDVALDVLERALPRLTPTEAARERARLVRRLCPERRAAWSELAAAASAPPAAHPLELEPEPSAEPTRVDGLHDTMDESVPPGAMLALDRSLMEEGALPPRRDGPWEPPPLDLPREAAVPTQIVQRRDISRARSTPRLFEPSPGQPAAGGPVEQQGLVGHPAERAAGGGLTQQQTQAEQHALPEGPMVRRVPEEELARSTRDRVLAGALVGVVIGLLALVGALALQQQGGWP